MGNSDVIDRERVLHVARLARLQLSDDEVAGMTRDLSAILTYVKQLEELDTASVEPTTHAVELHTHLRDDVPKPGLSTDAGLSNAPERIDDGFGVPKIIE